MILLEVSFVERLSSFGKGPLFHSTLHQEPPHKTHTHIHTNIILSIEYCIYFMLITNTFIMLLVKDIIILIQRSFQP